MARMLRAIVLMVLAFTAVGVLAQQTYYISKSLGADTNTATSKSTPWAHVPGMTGATGNAASHTPVAGDKYILYGGDTWGAADLPLEIDANGSGQCVTTPNSSCIYVGVDTTWYNSSVCGSSFCRPIFNQALIYETWYAMAYIYGQNVTLDNIEFTGMMTSAGNTSRMVAAGGGGGGDVIENSYFHGWEHSASGDADNSLVIAASAPNTVIHNNVINGADTLTATAVTGNPCSDPSGVCQGMNTAINGGAQIYDNYIANVTTGIATSVDLMHDNWIGPIWLGYTGGHRNGVQMAGTVSAAYFLAYNNILTGVQNGGMGGFWLEQGSTNAGTTAYVFNNILYNGSWGSGVTWGLGEGMQFCQLGNSCGPFYAFNNTMQSQFNLSGDASGTAYLLNNHCIFNTNSDCSNNEGSWTVHETTNLFQSTSTADANTSPHFDQYTGVQTYVFSPVASTNSTVGAGTNEQSLCTTIAGLNAAAGAACLNDTGYSCSYNTANHSVSCPDRTTNTRPSGAWDIGAYQFSSSAAAAPNPPLNLTFTVQ